MTVVNYKPSYKSAMSNDDFPQKQAINNGITYGSSSMPKKFRSEDGGTSFSLGRNIYNRAIHIEKTLPLLKEEYDKIPINSIKTAKGINYQSADQHIQRLKNIAIGKGSTTTNEKLERSFKSQNNANRNTLNTALRKARNSGYIVPKKKTAQHLNC